MSTRACSCSSFNWNCQRKTCAASTRRVQVEMPTKFLDARANILQTMATMSSGRRFFWLACFEATSIITNLGFKLMPHEIQAERNRGTVSVAGSISDGLFEYQEQVTALV